MFFVCSLLYLYIIFPFLQVLFSILVLPLSYYSCYIQRKMCTQTTISGQRFLFSHFHTLSFLCLLGDLSLFFFYVCWDILVSLTGFCLSVGSFMFFLFLLGNRSFIYCCGGCIMISNCTFLHTILPESKCIETKTNL